MRRPNTGHYQPIATAGDEPARAFVPSPLPPTPPLSPDGALDRAFEAAAIAVGRLDGIAAFLPDPALFIYSYLRKEAVLSSQIEGTQSSLSDLLLFELEEAPGAPLDDAREVSNYVAALEHGLRRMKDGFPLCNRLICEMHKILLSDTRGGDKMPGEFRRSQNWIGGARPGAAVFVPPPHTVVPDCMAAFENFLHADDGLPVLARAALAHVQFETIHPFLDGNGRVGRLLITLMLCDAGVLNEPLLYLSLYFKQNRNAYYEQLNDVRDSGDWETWLAFFMEGVRRTAEGAVDTAGRLSTLFAGDRASIQQQNRHAGSALRVHQALMERPLLSLSEIAKRTTLTYPTASTAMDALAAAGIAVEITGKRRNRVFAYDRYLNILSEGTEAL